MKNTIMIEIAACGKGQSGFSAMAYAINEEVAEIVIQAIRKNHPNRSYYRDANFRTRQILMDTTAEPLAA